MELKKISSFSQRLKEVLAENDISITAFAKRLSYSKQAISAYVNGTRSPKRPVIITVAQMLNVSEMWLCGYDVEKSRKNEEINPFSFPNIFEVEKRRIPLLGEIACGEPIFCNEDRESYVEVGTNIKADFCLKCKGDSMINARIHDGDIVFIRKQSIVNNGEIAVVVIDNEATLKRVFYYPEKGKLVLQSENPKYEPFIFVGEELNDINILGQAIAFQSDII